MPRRRSRSPAPARQSLAAGGAAAAVSPASGVANDAQAETPQAAVAASETRRSGDDHQSVDALYEKYGFPLTIMVSCLVLTAAMTGAHLYSSSSQHLLHSWSLVAAVVTVAIWDVALSHAIYKHSRGPGGSPTRTRRVASASNASADLPSVEPVDADLACPICFEVFYQPVSLECQHNVCKTCLVAWLRAQAQNREQTRCPVARCAISPFVPHDFNRALQAQCESRCPAAFASRKQEASSDTGHAAIRRRAIEDVAALRRAMPRFAFAGLLSGGALHPALDAFLVLLLYFVAPISLLSWSWRRYGMAAELLTSYGTPALSAQIVAVVCLFGAHIALVLGCCGRVKDSKQKKAAFEFAYYLPMFFVAALALTWTRPLSATLLDGAWCAGSYCLLFLWHGGHGLQTEYELASRPAPDQPFAARPHELLRPLATDWEPIFSQRHGVFFYRHRALNAPQHGAPPLGLHQTLSRQRAEVPGGRNSHWPAGVAASACAACLRLFFHFGGRLSVLGRAALHSPLSVVAVLAAAAFPRAIRGRTTDVVAVTALLYALASACLSLNDVLLPPSRLSPGGGFGGDGVGGGGFGGGGFGGGADGGAGGDMPGGSVVDPSPTVAARGLAFVRGAAASSSKGLVAAAAATAAEGGAGGFVHRLLLDEDGTVRATPLGLAVGCSLFLLPKSLRSGDGSDASRSETFVACMLACAVLQHLQARGGGWLIVRLHLCALPLADAIFQSCEVARSRSVLQTASLLGCVPCLLLIFARTLLAAPSTSWLAAVYTAPFLLFGLCFELFKGNDASWRPEWLVWSTDRPRRYLLLGALLLPLFGDLILTCCPDAQLLAEFVVTCTILCFLLFWRGLKPSAQPLAASLLVFTAAVPAFNLVGSNLALTAASTFPTLLSSGERLMRHGFGAVDSLQDWPWLVPVGRI